MIILVVDDDVDGRKILELTLKSEGYSVISAENGAKALEMARDTLPDMIISDILMPVMDGYQFCRACRKDARLAAIPFVFYSASYTDRKDQEFGLRMGAIKFIVKPMEPEQFLETIREVLEDYKRGTLGVSNLPEEKDDGVFLKGYSARLIQQLEKKVRELEESNEALRRSEADLKDLFESFVRAMVNALEAKSRWTTGHSRRVAGYAEQIAKEIGLGSEETAEIKMAALLHDIGKIGLKDYILNKPSSLTGEEFLAVQSHATMGAEILSDIKQLRSIIPAIRHHHEQANGSGYPDGIKGPEIGLYAEIIHIADAFDSITADRPYRQAQPAEYAISQLKKYAGQQFAPVVVEAFLRVLARKAERMSREKRENTQ